MNKPTLDVRFFKTNGGTEPVRDWLRELSAIDRKTIGEDIKTVQFGWPLVLLCHKISYNNDIINPGWRDDGDKQ